MKRFIIELVSGYCNLCTAVVAPSKTIADMLSDRGVQTGIEVIPTGVDPVYYSTDESKAFKKKVGIPEDTFVVGHVGRLAPEKNLGFLCQAVSIFLNTYRQAHFLLIGEGVTQKEVIDYFAQHQLNDRLHLQGVLQRRDLADAYRCMDVFVFASLSETQGLVLAEAMASGTPVVAVDAPGAREIVRDCHNGRLLQVEDPQLYAEALLWVAELPLSQRKQMEREARSTAEDYSLEKCTLKLLELYTKLRGAVPSLDSIDESRWERARNKIRKQFEILHLYGKAAEDAVLWMPHQKSRDN